MRADTYIRARIDHQTKRRATVALNEMGLSVSDAIRLLMTRVADDKRLPFLIQAPNATTRRALTELDAGNAKRFDDIDQLLADLNEDD